jgi:hypothetical protein
MYSTKVNGEKKIEKIVIDFAIKDSIARKKILFYYCHECVNQAWNTKGLKLRRSYFLRLLS